MMRFRKMQRGRVGRWLAAASAVIVLLGAAAIVQYLPVHGEDKIYDAVIRLHVVANSDSERDQAIKLKVRDRVLSLTGEAMSECTDRDQAHRRLSALLPELERQAEATLREEGCEQTVRVLLGEEVYPTRNYESFCFPSGQYLSLRVMIGEAEGQNFWCVLFPPLCLSAATKQEVEEELLAVGLTREQYALITQTEQQKYRLRFKFLETIEEWIGNERKSK